MAYRMTKEELDQQFEQFLKESVSDDSVELGSSSTRPSVLDELGKRPQKQVKKSHVSVPWWQDDDDDDDSEEAPGKVICPQNQLRGRPYHPVSVPDLTSALIAGWKQIPTSYSHPSI